MQFLKSFQHDEKLRISFNHLAKQTFGIQFEDWYQNGYWDDRYIPYSFEHNGEIIANVSANRVPMKINGEDRVGIQIGTVMTDVNFRNQGLSITLLQYVLNDFEKEADLFYLFANRTVLDFYPKFGFEKVQEHIFVKESVKSDTEGPIRKLNINDSNDLALIEEIVKNRRLVSEVFSCYTPTINMFHCLNVFPDDLFYDEARHTMFIFKVHDGEMHLFDVINADGKLSYPTNAQKLVLHFTPNNVIGFKTLPVETQDDVLFVMRNKDITLPTQFKHPVTSQA